MQKILTLLASAALMGLTLAAHADTYGYTFVETFTQPDFTFTSSVLINSTTNIVTSPAVTGLNCFYRASACTALSFVFGATDSISYTSGFGSGSITNISPSYFTVGFHGGAPNEYSLTITDTPTPTTVAATPEPSSLVLPGTGILGFAGAARRRFLSA